MAPSLEQLITAKSAWRHKRKSKFATFRRTWCDILGSSKISLGEIMADNITKKRWRDLKEIAQAAISNVADPIGRDGNLGLLLATIAGTWCHLSNCGCLCTSDYSVDGPFVLRISSHADARSKSDL